MAVDLSVIILKVTIMKLPRFLLADCTGCPEDVFVVHTEYPTRFIVNLRNDQMHWMDDVSGESEANIIEEMQNLLKEAAYFYDREMENYDVE